MGEAIEFYSTSGRLVLGTVTPVAGAPETTLAVTMFAPVTAEATSIESAALTPPAPQIRGGSGAVVVTCDHSTPERAMVFPLGTITLTCTARDAAGDAAQSTSTVTVVDTMPPTLAMFTSIVVEAPGPAGARVSVPVPTATDLASTPGVM